MLFQNTIFKYVTSTIRISQKNDNCNEYKVFVIGYLTVIINSPLRRLIITFVIHIEDQNLN